MELLHSGKEQIRTYLIEKGVVDVKEVVSTWRLDVADEFFHVGRFISNRSSLVVKQFGRASTELSGLSLSKQESAFFSIAQRYEYVSRFIPTFRFYDDEHNLVVYDEISDGESYRKLYKSHHIDQDELRQLSKWLSHVHRMRIVSEDNLDTENEQLQAYYHHRLFNVEDELRKPGFEFPVRAEHLESALNLLKKHVSGKTLGPIHGSCYPSNWISSDGELYIEDFKFFIPGPAELDLGIMTAHLRLASVSEKKITDSFSSYEDPAINVELINAYAGLEMIRTLLGYGYVKLSPTASQRKSRLHEGIKFLLSIA